MSLNCLAVQRSCPAAWALSPAVFSLSALGPAPQAAEVRARRKLKSFRSKVKRGARAFPAPRRKPRGYVEDGAVWNCFDGLELGF